MYIADSYNNRIRKVTVSTGIISTIAGTGTSSYSGDNGLATSATLYYPWAVSLDVSGKRIHHSDSIIHSYFILLGNVFIADVYNHRIRKVTVSTGIINTIAGSSTSGSYSGDGDQATSATLNYPFGVTADSSGSKAFYYYLHNLIHMITLYTIGNVFIADFANHRIRKVTSVSTNSPR